MTGEYTDSICESCGNKYKRIGSHWAQSECSYPELTDKQLEIVKGLLMGDGCLTNREGKPYVIVQCCEKKYLEHIDEIFGQISSGPPRLHITGEELMEKNGDWLGSTESSKYRDQYRWQTRSISDLSQFSEWYDNGNKEYPKDTELTSLSMKHWFAGDGNYNNNGTNDYISIGVSNERDNNNKINCMFKKSGLPEPNRWEEYGNKVEIVWNKEESREIMEFMGEAVPGYEYKWVNQ